MKIREWINRSRACVSSNNTTWEFKLRKGVKFHDGSDFTASDVKFSIERIPVVSGPNPTTSYVRRAKEVKIIDPLAVQVITDGASPTLPNDFIRLFIVSAKAAASLTKDNANEAFNSSQAAVGNGPYKFVSWQPKGDLVIAMSSDTFSELMAVCERAPAIST